MTTLNRFAGYSSGKTPAPGYKDWFVLASFQFAPTGSGSGPGTSQPRHERMPADFSATRDQDAMSQVLFQRCANGEPFRQMTVDLVEGDSRRARFLFDNVMVTGFQVSSSGSGSNTAMEFVTFSAESVKVEVD